MRSDIGLILQRFSVAACLLVSLGLQSGCDISLTGLEPDIQVDASREPHFVEGEPYVSVMPLIGRDKQVVGALVRTVSYEQAVRERDGLGSDSQPAGGEQVVPTRQQPLILRDSDGVHLIADQQHLLIDRDELAGGPWIYYLNADENSRRIQIAPDQAGAFRMALREQSPLEIVGNWCEGQAGEPLSERGVPLERR